MEKQSTGAPKVARNLPVSTIVGDGSHAPVIYFDGTVTAGHRNGVISATLVTQRMLPEGGQLKVDLCAIAYLRSSIPAAKELVAHLQAVIADAEQALLLQAMPSGPRN